MSWINDPEGFPYVVQVTHEGMTSYLASVQKDRVDLTANVRQAERFATELDARIAMVYLPEECSGKVVRM